MEKKMSIWGQRLRGAMDELDFAVKSGELRGMDYEREQAFREGLLKRNGLSQAHMNQATAESKMARRSYQVIQSLLKEAFDG